MAQQTVVPLSNPTLGNNIIHIRQTDPHWHEYVKACRYYGRRDETLIAVDINQHGIQLSFEDTAKVQNERHFPK